MAKKERKWHKNFLKYMEQIVGHPNYAGLPIERKADGTLKWIATAKSEVGKARIAWAKNKADELGIQDKPGMYADVMLAIHPTKTKVCQTCGKEMSLYYYYPNATFLKALNGHFNSDFTDCDNINDIWDSLIKHKQANEYEIAKFLIAKGGLHLNPKTALKNDVIDALELACRKGSKKCLGPGAMSNFPDRYDGFHTYNRCCRAEQDTGRSKENLKTYTKDRRAYEYWSDGNIHAANQFMGSKFFDGISADHVGPISLGFVHDPRYLRPMSTSDNSTKRDRLLVEDIELIVEIEAKSGIYPMSWQSKLIWEHIRKNYETHPQDVPMKFRDALKQNMTNFMYILRFILEKCPVKGKTFLIDAFLKPKYKFFDYTYSFNHDGEIIDKKPRHHTERTAGELDRYNRIAIKSVFDYADKDNRHSKADLTDAEKDSLCVICERIESGKKADVTKSKIISLVEHIESRIINSLQD